MFMIFMMIISFLFGLYIAFYFKTYESTDSRLNIHLRILFSPSCWIRIGSTSKVLDDWLRVQLNKKTEIIIESNYRVRIDNVVLWTGNFPYAYGNVDGNDNAYPSRAVVFRLNDAVEKTRLYGEY